MCEIALPKIETTTQHYTNTFNKIGTPANLENTQQTTVLKIWFEHTSFYIQVGTVRINLVY